MDVISGLTCCNLAFRYEIDLDNVVNCYHSAMDSLSDALVTMLAPQIKAVKTNLYLGCKRLNWNSLGMV